jgi:hypothetical protein
MSRSALLTTYHGTKHWDVDIPIRAASIKYQLSRGASLAEAEVHARGLLNMLNDPSPDRIVLSEALYQAQALGASSPFVSTSRKRDVALSFALEGGSPGYCVAITGPAADYFDFNAIRERFGIPHRAEFRWLEELGIPIEVASPFAIARVEYVKRQRSAGKLVFGTR